MEVGELALKRILITGGAGFIGSNLCKRLLEEEHEVFCLDNYSTSSRVTILPFLKNPRFTFIEQDVDQPIHFEVDEIYHLACPASPVHYQHNPVKTMRTNVIGAMNVLELAKEVHCKVLQASTSEVYGDPLVHPQVEEYWGNVNPIGKRSCYDEGKRCAETIFFDYARQFQIDIKVVRIFNTYGPNMSPDDGRVVSNFIVQALKGEDITIYGDGSQTRSFCYIDDLVEGMIRMMASPTDFKGPINLGNPNECTIRELAEKILQLTKSNSRLILRPLPEDDPKQRLPHIERARKQLGWEPKVPLEEGIQKTIEYFKRRLKV